MNFADKKTVEKLRKEFPVGCRIVDHRNAGNLQRGR